jgi:hypothetical protein
MLDCDNDSKNGWMDGWMDGRTDEQLLNHQPIIIRT